MIVPEFAIPLHIEDLEGNNHVPVSELGSCVTAAAAAESEEGAEFIVEHFETFCCVIKNFKQTPQNVRDKAMKLLIKAFNKMTLNLSVMLEEALDSELQEKTCNIVKMLGYLLIELAKRFQDYFVELASQEIKGKGKKVVKADGLTEWTDEKTQLMDHIYNFLQLPIKLLWEPPVVDEEFINLLANFCYKCLEDPNVTGVSMKPFRSSIFQVLATLIRRHLHGLSFCVKVVQLLRMHEHLVNPLAQGVVELVQDGCNNVVREIVREVGEADEQLLNDAGGTRCLSQFLSAVAEAAPSAVVSAVELLMAFLARDPPALRCCALTVLGEVVQAILTREDLDAELKATRDAHLDALEEHIHDTNAFVRTRALQVWQKLCLAKAIPVARLHGLLELVIGRLCDKSSNVKKQAVQLVKVLLEGNPYSGQLDVNDIKSQLTNEKVKLNNLLKTHNLEPVGNEQQWSRIETELKKAMNSASSPCGASKEISLPNAFLSIAEKLKNDDFSAAVGVFNQLKDDFYASLDCDGDDDEEASLQVFRKIWEQNTPEQVVPDISADVLERKEILERGVAYLEGALEFSLLIDRALPLILSLLDSAVQTDVLEAISFFTAACLFGFSRALDGVRRMLYLVFSKEPVIKAAVCVAYKELYFSNSDAGRKRSLNAVKSLSDLLVQLNESQMDALEEVVREWIRTDLFDKLSIQVLFERFSLKISGTTESQSWAALALIGMVGRETSKVIRNNVSVLVSEGLGSRGSNNFILAQYTCKALQNLAADGHKLAADDEILMRIRRLLREGLWSGVNHAYFVPFADEAITLVFMLAERPDAFMEELIVEMSLSLKQGKKPVTKHHKGRTLASGQDGIGDFVDFPDDEESQKNSSAAEIEDSQMDMGPEAALLRLTRFISILGTAAAHFIGFLENRVLGEFKRRNLADFERRLKRQEGKRGKDISMNGDKEDLEFMRVTADDMNTEEVRKVAEDHIVAGEGLLAKFVPLLQNIIKQPGKFPYQPLQNAAFLTLGTFMQVSSKVCDENLQLIVTITEKSQSVDKRRNGLLLLWALQFRFPNSLEPWTSHMFALLKDNEPSVRRTAVRVVTHLIVNEMVKARTHLSELAICLIDEDVVIAQTTRHFFREFSQKGNSLFNILPTLVTTLTGPNTELTEESFQTIMRFIMELVTKDKQQELLVEKLCQYFECAANDRQCRELAFCLSKLHYSEKALRKVLENFRCFGNKLYLAEVYEAFMAILSTAARNPQKDKNLLDELQALVKEYREKSCIDRNVPVTLPKKCPPSTKKRAPRRRQVSTDEDDEIDEKPIPQPVPRSTRKKAPPKKIYSASESEGELSENDVFIKKKSVPASARKTARPESSESDSGENCKKYTRSTRSVAASAKKSRAKSQIIEKSDSEEEISRPRRRNKKPA